MNINLWIHRFDSDGVWLLSSSTPVQKCVTWEKENKSFEFYAEILSNLCLVVNQKRPKKHAFFMRCVHTFKDKKNGEKNIGLNGYNAQM